MLNSVKLKNFRQHTELEVEFNGGLSVIRGANEAGKSTVFEAVAYALFGSSALRDSIEDVVTWGEAANSLKVELEMSIDGVTYSVKRSKSSAELQYDGGIVTNQKEVTAYACRLLKVDATAAARLTLSNQNEIRGALEAGPRATTDLIERLAEFDQIDKLIELMQEKLTLGNTATAEFALNAARDALQTAEAAAKPFDKAGLETLITGAAMHVTGLQAEVDALEWGEVKEVNDQVAARDQMNLRKSLEQGVVRAANNWGRLRDQLEAMAMPVAPDKVDEQVSVLRQAIVAAAAEQEHATAHARVAPFLKARNPDAVSYDGSVEVLRTEIASVRAIYSADQVLMANLDGQIKLLQQALTHGSCTFCGKDFSGVPEVAAKNAETQNKLNSVIAHRQQLSEAVAEALADLAAMTSIETASQPALKLLAALPSYVQLADNELPPVLRWIGPALGKPVDVKAVQAQIDELVSEQKAYERAVVQRESLQTQVAEAIAQHDEACRLFEGAPAAVELAHYDTALAQTRESLKATRQRLNEARSGLQQAEFTLKQAQIAYDQAVAAAADLREQVAQREKDVQTMEFNNALLKRVRQCRPIIADNLWSLILASVSSYFSEIRGVKSIVSKEADGFKVDGHSVTSMSGSTLDALGLAIRVALVRTFLPTAGFLILDEPCSAMDFDRTEKTLGFLTACGFGQILLITHESVSETIADQILMIGE